MSVTLPTLVEMSKTEHDLDLEVEELDDVLLDDDTESAIDEADLDDEDADVTEAEDDGDAVDDLDQTHDVADDETVAQDGGDEPYDLPPIVMATEATEADEPESDGDDQLAARTGVSPEVSDDVLEELRRSEIDGPSVEMAPQDDTSSAIRRPRRSADYDPAPFPIPFSVPRVLGRKPRVRRVTRVVRHVDPWSVFKIAIVANIVLYLIMLTAGVLLWNVAYATGTVDNVERFFESFGWSSFEFNGGQIYHNAWIGGLFVVIGLTGLAVLLATLFNLITDLVGGMRFTVLEEEVVEARPSPMRRFVVRRAEPEVPVVSYDESGPIVREVVVDDSGGFQR